MNKPRILPPSRTERATRKPALSPPSIPDYTLVRCIGRGSYGEVWLARGVMGGWRAIKIVSRRSFDQARPFERELSGLRKYEPLSRAHDNLVAVLHVGRNEEEGFFYYAMELADDQQGGPGVDPERYAPRTLHSVLAERERLPPAECVRIGLALAGALDHLHRNGLVHRDVKPSNIIFVNGSPKLADIGLVTDTAGTQSFVGTEGFLPPEGPGAPQADLFALGKVLYEMVTGRDRKEFPELPTALREWPDREGILELNEVVLKACQAEPRRRYQSAEALRADLALLAGGKSVLSVHSRRRRTAWAAKCAVVLLGLAVAGVLVQQWSRRSDLESRRLAIRQRAAEGERQLESGNVAGSLLWYADALRLSEAAQEDSAVHRLRWSWIWRACPKFVHLFPHDGPVHSVAFSPDDRAVLTASEDGSAQVWDAATSLPIGARLRHQGPVRNARFSPDGRSVLTSSEDGSARVWDAGTGVPRTPFLKHEGILTCAVFSPDGRRVLTGGLDRTVRGWEAETGTRYLGPVVLPMPVLAVAIDPGGRVFAVACGETTGSGRRGEAQLRDALSGDLAAPTLAHSAPVLALAFAPHGPFLATACEDGTARVWEVATGRPVGDPLKHTGPVVSVAFDTAGDRVATASADRTARIWDASTGQPLTPPLKHGGLVHRAVFSHDGRWLATAADDQAARVWEASTGTLLHPALQHGSWVADVGFAANPNGLLTCGGDGQARLWDLSTTMGPSKVFATRGPVHSAALSPDGRLVAVAAGALGSPGGVWRWDGTTGKTLGEPFRHSNMVSRICFSPDGTRVLTAGYDGSARIWNPTTGTPITPFFKQSGPIWQALFSPDGQLALTAGGDSDRAGEVRVWEATTGAPAMPVLNHPAEVMGAAFSPDGSLVLTGCGAANGPGEARLWQVRSGQPLGPALRHAGPVWDCAFSPDGQRVATASLDQSARLWSASNGHALGQAMKHGGWVVRVVFSAEGRKLATASVDQSARIWDAHTGEPLTPPLRHEGAVSDVVFSPDGRLLLTASADRTARLWDAGSGAAVVPPIPHEGAVRNAFFNRDGSQILTACQDGHVRIWDLPQETRPVADCISMAGLISGLKVSEGGVAEPIPPAELRKRLSDLRRRCPNDFTGRAGGEDRE